MPCPDGYDEGKRMYPELSFSTLLVMMLATNPADATGAG
jgi:hypothetical protein